MVWIKQRSEWPIRLRSDHAIQRIDVETYVDTEARDNERRALAARLGSLATVKAACSNLEKVHVAVGGLARFIDDRNRQMELLKYNYLLSTTRQALEALLS